MKINISVRKAISDKTRTKKDSALLNRYLMERKEGEEILIKPMAQKFNISDDDAQEILRCAESFGYVKRFYAIRCQKCGNTYDKQDELNKMSDRTNCPECGAGNELLRNCEVGYTVIVEGY